ncbi:MAG: cytochrome C oxidase subunit I [Bacteroidetes bacterium]|jgi:hypothetical protein|nr:cytochrome C oxidase subunit I [Bacteroidota bacterium]
MITGNASIQQTTTHKVVIPFYIYASLSLLAACVMLLLYTDVFDQHHFHPKTLAITHTMALGWGTMIILGASYQLVPVLVENALYSERLALISFVLAAIGIPLLVYGFFVFNMALPARVGGTLVNLAVLAYIINLILSIPRHKSRNVHAIFILTAGIWLFITTLTGLLLVYNFNDPFLPQNSLRYLSLHAHIGLVGWFLMLVLGVGTRLLPMFMISKYTNNKQLWIQFVTINLGLLLYILFDLASFPSASYMLPAILIGYGIFSFIWFCRKAYQQRIRKKIDGPMQISLLAVMLMIVPFIVLLVLILIAYYFKGHYQMGILYGFFIFFGWLTAIIMGMTFKTLPFIVWNKIYHKRAGQGKTPVPKALFSEKLFQTMFISYIIGFLCFATGLMTDITAMLKIGAAVLLMAAVFYNINVQKIVFHKPAS